MHATLSENDFLSDVNNIIKSVCAIDETEIWQTVQQMACSGKQLRPRLVFYLSQAQVSSYSDDYDALIRDAAALELIHTSTLVHDDIIDASDFRRNVSTINHTYGNHIALLVGNMIKDQALSIASPSALKILNQTSLDINKGQLWETIARSYPDINVADYIMITLFKTGRIFRFAAEITNLYAKKPIDEVGKQALETAAIAYQIIDDYNDIVVSSNVTGKNAQLDESNGVHSFFYANWNKNITDCKLPFLKSLSFPAGSAVLEILANVQLPFLETLKLFDISQDQLPLLMRGIVTSIQGKACDICKNDKPVTSVMQKYFTQLLSHVEAEISL